MMMMSMAIKSIIIQSVMILGNTVISIKLVFSFWQVPDYIPCLSSDGPCP